MIGCLETITRGTSGMLLVGLMMYGFMSFSASGFGQPNHYYVQGVGYATIMDILNGGLTAAGFLLFLGVVKLLATCLTLGSGPREVFSRPACSSVRRWGRAAAARLRVFYPAWL